MTDGRLAYAEDLIRVSRQVMRRAAILAADTSGGIDNRHRGVVGDRDRCLPDNILVSSTARDTSGRRGARMRPGLWRRRHHALWDDPQGWYHVHSLPRRRRGAWRSCSQRLGSPRGRQRGRWHAARLWWPWQRERRRKIRRHASQGSEKAAISRRCAWGGRVGCGGCRWA